MMKHSLAHYWFTIFLAFVSAFIFSRSALHKGTSDFLLIFLKLKESIRQCPR